MNYKAIQNEMWPVLQPAHVPLNTTFFTAELLPHSETSITRVSPEREKQGGSGAGDTPGAVATLAA